MLTRKQQPLRPSAPFSTRACWFSGAISSQEHMITVHRRYNSGLDESRKAEWEIWFGFGQLC